MNLISKSFFHISSYLHSKYNNKQLNEIELNIFNGTSNQTKEKKLIRIFEKTTTDPFYTRQIRNLMTEGLENEFIFQFTSDNPDYVVYDTFNCYYLNPKYNDTIKIAFFTENKIPDFYYADYAIGFDNLNYLDRYFRKTTLIAIFSRKYLNFKNKDFMEKRKEALNKKIRKKFCASVISNSFSSDKFRLRFITFL